MNILVLSNIEWSDSNSFGNTVTNLFSSVPNIELASLYRRSSMPSNNVCRLYYKIPTLSIIKNFFTPQKIGSYFKVEDYKPEIITIGSEKNFINFIHKLKLNKIVYFLEDAFFSTRRWENDNFKKFINSFNPDIVFCFVEASKTQTLLMNVVRKYVADCKFVVFLADDIYAAYDSNKHKKNIKKQLKAASKIYAITPSLKRKYEELFNVEIDILTKGCDFSLPVTQKQDSIKTIVYAGNLLYGREKILIRLGQEINQHNKNSDNKLMLKIYSPTVVDDSVKNAMNIPDASEFLGAKPYSEIVEIMNSADVVLHVESFDEKQQKIVKHSFSTKITDCMQSGSVLFSIGPDGLSSIEATQSIDGAFCAINFDEITETIKQIAYADLYDNAKRIREYAIENFSLEKIQQKLINDFKEII